MPKKSPEPYEFDPRSVKPTGPPIAMNPPRHYVKATVCGKARKGHPMTSDWDEVDCRECLTQAPDKARKASP